EMLRRGLVRVHTTAEDRSRALEMLEIEAAARRARRGIWRDPYYAVRRPEEAGRFVESFQLVEGQVATADRVKGDLVLNFGPDWHTAFALRIPHAARPLFAVAALDPTALAGRHVRVRGWIGWDRRPIAEATHPEQIEVL